jgi:hypothetical protein
MKILLNKKRFKVGPFLFVFSRNAWKAERLHFNFHAATVVSDTNYDDVLYYWHELSFGGIFFNFNSKRNYSRR